MLVEKIAFGWKLIYLRGSTKLEPIPLETDLLRFVYSQGQLRDLLMSS